MKKIIFAFMGFIVLSACADGNVNQDLYNKDNPDFASQPAIPFDDPTFTANQYINLANQWSLFIDKQTMRGVYFPHDVHRRSFSKLQYLNTTGELQVFISGCTSCHVQAGDTFIQNRLTANNLKISGPSVTTNAGHEFCWTTCHNQIADPNSAPKQNECAKCHKVENIRAGQLIVINREEYL